MSIRSNWNLFTDEISSRRDDTFASEYRTDGVGSNKRPTHSNGIEPN
jgi:hypothetical protein